MTLRINVASDFVGVPVKFQPEDTFLTFIDGRQGIY